MAKLLIISGPTATGKTDLAVKIARKFNGELISADSRQIYKNLDIGVGKDHPQGTLIHLVDLISPDQSFSVSQFRDQALTKIKEIQTKNKLPILVGCSGFYIDSVINPKYTTFTVKPNPLLRNILFKLPVKILQFLLKVIDKKTFMKLNNSDFHNPLRLVRKIEIKLSPPGPLSKRGVSDELQSSDVLHLSLTAPKKYLYSKIDARVESRLKIGFLNELKYVLKKYSWSDPGLKISAYACLKPYIQNPSDTVLADCIQKWKYAEHRDARRGLTWFNKIHTNHRLDISQKSYQKIAFNLISEWYNKL